LGCGRGCGRGGRRLCRGRDGSLVGWGRGNEIGGNMAAAVPVPAPPPALDDGPGSRVSASRLTSPAATRFWTETCDRAVTLGCAVARNASTNPSNCCSTARSGACARSRSIAVAASMLRYKPSRVKFELPRRLRRTSSGRWPRQGAAGGPARHGNDHAPPGWCCPVSADCLFSLTPARGRWKISGPNGERGFPLLGLACFLNNPRRARGKGGKRE
jgi:hypothetical protein